MKNGKKEKKIKTKTKIWEMKNGKRKNETRKTKNDIRKWKYTYDEKWKTKKKGKTQKPKNGKWKMKKDTQNWKT